MHSKSLFIALVAFVAIQPLIDVLTLLSMTLIGSEITVGVIVRAVYMVVLVLLLLTLIKKVPFARWYVLYLIGLALLVITNMGINLQVKDPYYLFQELKFINKVIYFHIVFFGLLALYQQLKVTGFDIAKKSTSYLFFAGTTIGVIFVLAHLTGTSLSNYAYTKVGFSGWFYAGNEIGAIMAIVLPIVALWAIERTHSLKQVYFWIPFLLLSFGMIMLGTKVGYGGIIIVLLSVLIGSMILWGAKQKSKQVKTNLIVSLVLTLVLLVITPFTPVFGNMFAHISLLGIDLNAPPTEQIDEETGEVTEVPSEESTFTNEQVQNLVFSSREKYVVEMEEQFAQADPLQQLFGMGFAGNYEVNQPLKMIEMDFHDWFFSFGVIGFLYMMAPIIWFTGKFVWYFIRNIKATFTYFNILYGVAYLLGMGIAFTAGHVLTAPAVSIYLAAILAMVTIKEHK